MCIHGHLLKTKLLFHPIRYEITPKSPFMNIFFVKMQFIQNQSHVGVEVTCCFVGHQPSPTESRKMPAFNWDELLTAHRDIIHGFVKPMFVCFGGRDFAKFFSELEESIFG